MAKRKSPQVNSQESRSQESQKQGRTVVDFSLVMIHRQDAVEGDENAVDEAIAHQEEELARSRGSDSKKPEAA